MLLNSAVVLPLAAGMRISTSRAEPKFCTCTSLIPKAAMRSRMGSMATGCAKLTSIKVPPVNSTERCRPRLKRKNTAAKKVSKEIALNTKAWRMNGMSLRILKNSMAGFL